MKKDPEKNLFEKLSTPFRPFALDMWLAILGTAVGGALFMWIIEHSNTDDNRYYPKRSRHLTPMEYNHILRKEAGFHRKPDGGGEEVRRRHKRRAERVAKGFLWMTLRNT